MQKLNLSRKGFIGVGLLSFLGIFLPQILKAERASVLSKEGKAKNVI
jgi:hypothetical protein